MLLQSGLDEKRWADSMECYCALRNVQDLLAAVKPPNERRFGEPRFRPRILFGSMAEFLSTSAKDQSRLYQFGTKVLPGIFTRYALYVGEIWD